MHVQNPHDKFFKQTLSNVATAKDFLSTYLPQTVMDVVNLDTLEPQKDSFINQQLTESFSDLLFKVDICDEEGFLYFLFEHKSYPDKRIALQLLSYMVEIWKTKTNNEEEKNLPIIIPLVLYHGITSWRVPANLGSMLSGYTELSDKMKRHIPNFDFIVYDLSNYEDDDIKGSVQTRILMTLLRDIFTKDSSSLRKSLLKSVQYLNELDDEKKGIEYLETMMRYVFSAGKSISKRDVQHIINEIETTYPEGSELAMSMADIWREEGMEKGWERGMEKGLELGGAAALSEATIQVLTEKFGKVPDDVKQGIANADIATLKLLILKSLSLEEMNDVRKYI